ncbi:hypothetical protein E2C01_006489 [Portunus trituberculatus]|uniref:Uncharacterized protein n=1 Tax=Portunus trituberculatus TaxID=210409 RepID=A0A5B7CZP5_PORTR|nr:hypothetical protein [Portunus trituberculatus]
MIVGGSGPTVFSPPNCPRPPRSLFPPAFIPLSYPHLAPVFHTTLPCLPPTAFRTSQAVQAPERRPDEDLPNVKCRGGEWGESGDAWREGVEESLVGTTLLNNDVDVVGDDGFWMAVVLVLQEEEEVKVVDVRVLKVKMLEERAVGFGVTGREC